MSVLEELGDVAADYRHVEKRITPGQPIELPRARLKWYRVAPANAPVPAAVDTLARAAVRAAATGEDGVQLGGLGFVILHRCGASFYFLLICTWRGNNEVWETVLAKDGDADPEFRAWPISGPHRPTYCVWELGAVWHEQQAWSRYLRSPRERPDKLAYLADAYSGPV